MRKMERLCCNGVDFDVLSILAGEDKVQMMMFFSRITGGLRLNQPFLLAKMAILLKKLNIFHGFT